MTTGNVQIQDEQLESLRGDVRRAGSGCVVWDAALADKILRALNDEARQRRYLERRIVELESDLNVARQGLPRSP